VILWPSLRTGGSCFIRQVKNILKKELRPPSSGRSEIRILFVFDPWRSAILLIAGDKSGQWEKWYRAAIPRAERLYGGYLAERRKEMGP
jgi:hypothetical protein